MLGILWLLFFLICGYILATRIFSRANGLHRAWAGGVFGLLGAMWMPVPFAFVWGFSPFTHMLASLSAAALTALVMVRWKGKPMVEAVIKIPVVLYFAIFGMCLLMSWIFFQQILLLKNGVISAAPDAWGELPHHFGIITNVAESQVSPPKDPFFSGARLSYHFLVDTLSSSLCVLGLNLRWAVLLPSFCLVFILVVGFFIFVYEILAKAGATIVAALIFFFNSGFGFIYYFDALKKNPGFFSSFLSSADTPTWMGHNMMMPNILNYFFIPNRPSFAGWAFLFFALWLLYKAVAKGERRFFWLAGLIGGLLLMVQVMHAFVFLVIALTWMIVYLFPAQHKAQYIKGCVVFGTIFSILAGAQFLIWIAPHVTGSTSPVFMFNAINQEDIWIWFWIKNVGIVFLLMFPALIAASAQQWRFYSPGIVLFIVAESVRLNPWATDNNKVYLVWVFFSAILVAGFMADLYRRMRGIRGRWVFSGMLLFFATFSGFLSVIHDLFGISYNLLSKADVEVADFVRTKTLKDAVFLTAPLHGHPVVMLAGRSTVCGYGGYLWGRGVDYGVRERDVAAMFAQPESFLKLYEKYYVDYVYLGSAEFNSLKAKLETFEDVYPRIFFSKGVSIYAVSSRAQEFMKQQ